MLLWRHLLSLSLVLCWLSLLSSTATASEEDNETDVSDLDSSENAESADRVSEGFQEDGEQIFESSISLSSKSPLIQSFATAEALLAHTAILPQLDLSQVAPSSAEVSNRDFGLSVEYVDALENVSIPLTTIESEAALLENEQSLAVDTLDGETEARASSQPSIGLLKEIEAPIVEVENIELDADNLSVAGLEDELVVLPVGMNAGDRNVLPSVLIKGTETGDRVGQWLLPFESVAQVLGLTVEILDNGEWELRSSGLAVRLAPDALQMDADIGLSISVDRVNSLLGVPTRFEQLDYAIRFDPAWLGTAQSARLAVDRPVLVEGLPTFWPDRIGVSGVSQQISVSSKGDRETETRGSLSSLGTAFGGSWYVQAEQPSLAVDSWHIREFQYLRQTDTADVALGSQPTFWDAREQTSEYWGVSYVQRWGFEPPEAKGMSGFNPRERLQASAVGRTISGEAEPGTLVRLAQGFRNVVVDEVLVDSSGVYRFEDVVSRGNAGSYQVLLYPDGQLTAIPEVQSASFSTLPGQLPVGASALIASGGVSRQSGSSNGFLGRFGEVKGGATYRRGISETLTLGVGVLQDRSPQMLAEAFYVPDKVPVKVAVSALVGLQTANVDVTADVQYRPSSSFYLGLNSDRFSQRFNAEWQLGKGLSLLARGSTREEAVAGGVRFSWSDRNFFLLGSATIDTKERARWSLSSRIGALGMQHYGNEIATRSEVSYNLSGNYAYGDGHSVFLNYETQRQSRTSNQLGTASWRYRSERRVSDGSPVWDAQLGYGVGSWGSGVVATMTTAVIPGADIQVRYQGVSALDDQSSFQLELRPRLGFRGNRADAVMPANRYQERLRTQGGLLFQPFFDENGNGHRDAGEALYQDNLDLLLSVNYEDLRQYRPDIRQQGAFITLPPDTYRVDLDPAGYPLDWRADETSYAAVTAAGQYTAVEIPLSRSYTLMGTVADDEGRGVAGQRVEAVNVGSAQRQLSVTNAAGIFYLEGLREGDYRFEIDSVLVEGSLNLKNTTEGVQEVNFQVFSDGIKIEEPPSELEAVAVEI